MNKQIISAVIAVKNEEKRIKDCLESLKWVGEIIIIDHHSTDNTIKICKKYTNKIFKCDGGPKGLIEYNKNFGFRKAMGDWILSIDADEVISPALQTEIINAIQKNNKAGFLIRFYTYFLGKPLRYSFLNEFRAIRLFKKGKGYYPCNKNHEKLILNGRIGSLHNSIVHLWGSTISDLITKTNFYTSQDSLAVMEKVGIYKLLLKPAGICLRTFLKGGYKDGMRGLILSILFGFYFFLEKAKIWENQFKSKK